MGGKRVAKTILVIAVSIVAVLGVGYLFLRVTGIIDPDACISERMKTMPNLSGAKVEIVYTNCDTLAKDEAISVYFSRAAVTEESWFANWRNHRTLVLRYDPGRPSDPPAIDSAAKDRILISIPEVSSVALQHQKWRDISIDYKIDGVMKNP
jgi:hypothetical protein